MRLTKREREWIEAAKWTNGLALNVESGDMKIIGWRRDGPLFKLTRQGINRAKGLIAQSKEKGEA